MYAALVTLPLLEIASFKLPAPTAAYHEKVRLFEVILWALTPAVAGLFWRRLADLPRPLLIFVVAVCGYLSYTVVLGIGMQVVLLKFTPQPTLETARMIAGLALVAAVPLLGLPIRTVFRALVIGAAIAAAYAIVWIGGHVLGGGLYSPVRPTGGFFEPRGLGIYGSVMLPLAAYLATTSRGRPRIGWLLIGTLIFVGAWLPLSRSGVLGTVGAGMVLFLAAPRTRLPIIGLVASSIIVLALIELAPFLASPARLGPAKTWYAIHAVHLPGVSVQLDLMRRFPMGTGQNLSLHNGFGGSYSALPRWVTEGGVVGTGFVLLALWAVIQASRALPVDLRPWVLASFVAAAIATVTYGRSTDAWLLFAVALPLAALAGTPNRSPA